MMSKKDSAIWSYHQPPWKPAPKTSSINQLLELKLYDLFPVPGNNVPYNDILDFKLKRKDELKQLQLAIDTLLEEAQRASDTLRAEDRAITEVSTALNDLRRVADESFATRFVRSLKVSVNLPNVMVGAGAGTLIVPVTGLSPIAGAAFGTAVALISVEAIAGERQKGLPDGVLAYNYAAEAEWEFAR